MTSGPTPAWYPCEDPATVVTTKVLRMSKEELVNNIREPVAFNFVFFFFFNGSTGSLLSVETEEIVNHK